MKLIAALLLFHLGALAADTVAPAQTRQRFYRAHHTGTIKHQAGGLSVVNAASFEPGISPGGLATVLGQNLSGATGTFYGQSNPLPFSLADVRIAVNGVLAPLFSLYVSNSGATQISFQVPYHTPTGPGAATVDVVDPAGNVVATTDVDSFTEDPGIFTYAVRGDEYALAVHATTNSLVGPDNPASPGEDLVVYTTGLGPLTVALQDGYGAPDSPLAYTQVPPDVQIAGESALIEFSGLAPGFVGLNQVNIRLPRDLPPGLLDMRIVTPASTSLTVTLPVR